jgi:hypothetical protein
MEFFSARRGNMTDNHINMNKSQNIVEWQNNSMGKGGEE